ncbi:outer membrane beta-barrel protein [Telluribacter sp.]|jgi:opacity protein-like surface antigen|uniref:outer membrane beta-barrel protein n=1 Tax=Telluribacter sp. TaxID=1978767 RepID=UPI002E123D51|nr:outer membrane beta-barrel protein [Telluribacter sp.]
MKRLTIITTISALLLLGWGIQAQDIRSNTEGISLSGTANYCHWSSSFFDQLDELEPNGLGAGLRVGYGFNQRFEVFLSYEGFSFRHNLPEEWDVYRMNSLGAGLRMNLGGTLQRLRPFVEVGYSSHNLLINPVFLNGNSFEFRMKGPAIMASGGLRYFLSENLALNASVGGSYGKISSFLGNGSGFEDRPDIRTVRANVGVSFFIH